MNVDIAALRAIERDKDIPFETVMEAIETALLTAYKHTPHSMPHARVEIDRKSGEITVWAQEFGPESPENPGEGSSGPPPAGPEPGKGAG